MKKRMIDREFLEGEGRSGRVGGVSPLSSVPKEVRGLAPPARLGFGGVGRPAPSFNAAMRLSIALMLICGWWATSPFDSSAKAQSTSTARDAVDGGESSDADSEAPASGGETSESFLMWMYRASGWIGLVIVAMSFYLIALVVWMAVHFRASVAIPRGLVREVQEMLDQKMYSEAYHRLTGDRSLLARVLSAGVRKLPSGLPLAQRAMELANEDATMQMEHRTTYLATVGTLGPMIGLVGTVYGMILAFRVIATEGATPQASELARGISTALFATLEGIAISIPAIYFYAFYRNRIARLSLEAGIAAEPLLEQFAPGVRVMASGASAAPSMPTAPPVPSTVPVHVPTPRPQPTPSSNPQPNPNAAAAHPHPFAVRAALAASPVTGSAEGGRSELPMGE
jgi:biopolymer transport protein ExbB